MRNNTPGSNTPGSMSSLRLGALISGGLHLALLLAALFGVDWLRDREPLPLAVADVEIIDGAVFDAAVSTAPVVPNTGPAELREPAQPPSAQNRAEPLSQTAQSPSTPPVLSRPPAPRPDAPVLDIPPPPVDVPSETPAPSIAQIPSPDPVDRQAPEPESPEANEAEQARADAESPEPALRPKETPKEDVQEEPDPSAETSEPDPTAAEPAPPQTPKPTQAEQEEEPQAQPDAPQEQAPPRVARLPLARPAEIAAAAAAAAKAEAAAADNAEKPTEEKPAETSKPAEPKPQKAETAAPGGSSARQAVKMSRGDANALSLSLRKYFIYNGNRSDLDLRLVVRVRLDRAGKIIEGPNLQEESGGTAQTRNALFQAARRALLRAQNANEFQKLPPEKYDGWQLIDFIVTPERIGF